MKPYLWIAYDYTSTSQCLGMLDTVLEKHPDNDIIHEIGRPTLLHAVLEGVSIVSEFRKRLNNNQMLVADFKGFDVPAHCRRSVLLCGWNRFSNGNGSGSK